MKKELLLKFYSKYKQIIFPVAVALSSLILIALVILPQTIKLISNQKTGSELLTKSQFLEVKAQSLETLDLEDLSKKVQYALNVYPPDRDFGNVLGIIQNLTNKAGFTMLAFNLGGSAKDSAQNYGITIQLVGPRQLIPAMLQALENEPRLMRVESIEINKGLEGDGVELSLGVAVLYSPLPQNLGTVDSILPELSQKEEEILIRLATTGEQVGITVLESETIPATGRGKANPFE